MTFLKNSSLVLPRLSVFLLAFALAAGYQFSPLRAQSRDTSPPAPKHIHLKSSQLDAYVGQYRITDEPEVVYSFSRDGDRFFVETARDPRTEIFAESAESFFIKGSTEHFAFVRTGGKVTQVRREGGRRTEIADRISSKPVHNNFIPYDRREVMIPMRDGVKLHAVILRPVGVATPLPFLMQRTPYGVDDSTSDTINQRYTELAQSGYIFVMEDIRGRYKSEGQFVMMRPLADHKNDPKAVDESTDTYDTVDWLVKNVPDNNQRVGVIGVSYPGFLATEAGIDPHPDVKAISPQAPMTDVWLGDDFFHNGAFRQTYGYDYAIGMESSKENAFSKLNEDAYDYFLGGSFADAGKKSGMTDLPTWKGFLEHPGYDEFWRARAVESHLDSVAVPTLEVGGWWDQEDMWGPQAQYAALEPHNTAGDVFLVLGPWNHGQWGRTTRHLGDVDFGAPVGDQFRAQIEAPFFAHYLKDQSTFDLTNTASFQTGSNQWKRYGHWPPTEGIQVQNLYLEADGGLAFDKPKANDASDFTSYVSDPANPVPYRRRPIEATYAPSGSGWYTWLVEDQRFLAGRKDIAAWSTPVLDHDLTITGEVLADIFASTSGTDSDWIVKLIDVYPDDAALGKMSGYQLMITDEIFRGRYRKSFEKPEAAKPDDPVEYNFSLHGADHVFLKGHRVLVQVQSTWFPLYDRNPQTFVPNIMTAAPDSYQAATQKIYWSAKYPSHLELPVAR